MPNIVLSVLGSDRTGDATRSAEGNLDRLQKARESASAALIQSTNREADAAGRVKVAEAQLAEARSKYADDSSQVVRASERLASAQRTQEGTASAALNANERLAGADARLKLAAAEAADSIERSSGQSRRAFSEIGDAARRAAVQGESSLDSLGEKASSFVLGLARNTLGVAAGFAVYNLGARALSGAYDLAKGSVIDLNSQMENAQIAFTTMLGSGTKAKSFLDDLQAFAARTPFEFPDLVTASQRLIAMGVHSKDVIPYMTGIGDAAAGLGGGAEKIDVLTNAIGQMTAKGKVQGDELLQLTEAGVPALKILADHYHVSASEMSHMISTGKVLSADAVPAIIDALEKGTKSTAGFGGMMEKQSTTLSGAMSNISDSVNQTLSKAFLPFFHSIEDGAQAVAKFAGSKEVQKWAKDTGKSVEDFMKQVGDGIQEVFGDPQVQKSAKDLLGDINKGFHDAGPILKTVMPDLIDFGKEVLPEIFKGIGKVAKTAPDMARDIAGIAHDIKASGKQWADFIGWVSDLASGFTGAADQIDFWGRETGRTINKVHDFYAEIPKWIADAFNGARKWLTDAGHNIIDGLTGGIKDRVDGLMDIVHGVGKTVADVFAGAIDSHSPSKVFQQLGTYITDGLALGIQQGTADDVASAMDDLTTQVTDGYQNLSDEVAAAREKEATTEEQIATAKRTARQLARDKDAAEDALAAAKTEKQRDAARRRLAAIDDRWDANQRRLKKLNANLDDLEDTIRTDKSFKRRQSDQRWLLNQISWVNGRLSDLAKQRDAIADRLNDANSSLTSAQNTRSSFSSGVYEGLVGAGSITNATGQTDADGNQLGVTAADQVGHLQNMVASAAAFRSSIASLRNLGLNDESYKELVQQFQSTGDNTQANSLLAGGADAVRQVNDLEAQLKDIAGNLGDTTAGSLYDAGVQAAQGLVDGLKSQQAALTETMTNLAQSMVAEIKSELGIKSPSRVFKQQGLYVTEGLVEGLIAGQPRVNTAVSGLVNPASVAIPALAGASTGGTGAMVHIDSFYATPEQSPADIAAGLGWLARGGL